MKSQTLFKKSLPGRNWTFTRRMLYNYYIEYYGVAKRTFNPDLIAKARKVQLTRSQMLTLIAIICDEESIPIPKVVLPAKGTHAKNYRDGQKSVLHFKQKDFNAHSVIHEVAHLKTCFMEKKHHGKIFCIYQDYLLHEYQSVWMNLKGK